MIEFLGFKKKTIELQGQALIGDVVDKFSIMIENLEKGIHDCEVEQADINSQVDSLMVRNQILGSSVKRGQKLSVKLSELLGQDEE